MPLNTNPSLDEAILYVIQKDRALVNKSPLVIDMGIINDETSDEKTKLAAFERLIAYLSHLPTWDEELITYLGNRFMYLKLRKNAS
ncbi:MAG: hypothetical protein ACKVOU_01505 [Cytophagales bacterium]